jgi:hypothetical protein
MKKVKVSLLALCAFAGGALVASAAKGDKGFTYDLNVTFTNPVTILDISGVPQVNTNFSLNAGNQGVALTDGSGKIDGVWDMYITGLSNAAPLVDGDYIVDLGGSITTVTKSGNPIPTPVVNMTMKGNGRSRDALDTTNGPASFSLTFNNKASGGIATRTNIAGPFTTNVTLVEIDSDGDTNIIDVVDFNPVTNVVVRTAPITLPFLTFTVNTSDTNASPIINRVSEQNGTFLTNAQFSTFYFGSGTLISNLFFVFGTNVIQVSALGTNINFRSQQALGATNATPITANTNVIFGIDSASVGSFITAFTQFNTSTTNPFSAVSRVVTNIDTTAGSGANSSGTNVTFVNGIPVFSNSWLEVSGLINGSIKQGKKSTSVKNASGLFTTEHSIFTPFTQTSFETNGTGTNAVITTNVTQFVLEQDVNGGSLDLEQTTHFSARLVQFNKSIWSSSSEGFSGKGTLSPSKTKQTYTLNQKGVSRSKGSTLTFKGNTDSNYVAGVSIQTNIVIITNVASIGQVSHTFTNITGFPQFQSPPPDVTSNIVIIIGPPATTNIVVSQNSFAVTIPGLSVTNIDTLGIRTVTATGKIKGQALPKTGISGTNSNTL